MIHHVRALIVWFLCAIVVFSCSGMEQSEKDRLKRQNQLLEPILRKSTENLIDEINLQKAKIPKYPWEVGSVAGLPKITKEFFRCKGSRFNPTKVQALEDCYGIDEHGLPMRDGQEFAYPIFMDILNYIQSKTSARVIVTCCHRCPKHNSYADSSKFAKYSKHLVAGEVDFYVEGYEHRPQEIIQHLINYYHLDPDLNKNFGSFRRFQNPKKGLSSPGWYNKEIAIYEVKANEGRDFDNNHSYPYITIELRYDRDSLSRVEYNWNRAYKGYMRW